MTAKMERTDAYYATREQKLYGMKAMIEWLDNHPEVPIPYSLSITNYVEVDEGREIRKAAHGWTKRDHGDYFQYIQDFTPDLPEWAKVTYKVIIEKEATCQKVITGYRDVEATEAHTEPIYEWRCGDDIHYVAIDDEWQNPESGGAQCGH